MSRALRKAGVQHAVCGGMAMAVHGVPRATRDLDILVQEVDAARAELAAARAGFTLSAGIIPFDVGKPTERRIVRVSKARGEDLLTLDLILATPALVPVWDDRLDYDIGGERVPFVSKHGLVTMKRLAGRTIGRADIEALEGSQ